MSSKQASPLTGALILAGFIVIGVAVMITVRGKLQLQDHDQHSAHHSTWADTHTDHSVMNIVAEIPRTVLAAYESSPRAGAKVRTLREFYARRAYPGAPPVIPHAVQDDGVMNDDCLSCHEEGGYVPEYNAYTPVTPHPDMANCRQCHVTQLVETNFVPTDWVATNPPKRGRQAIPGGPLLIPHPLQMRENCAACHAGPQAVVEIRSSHPERENCLQCHVVDLDIPPFQSIIDPRMELADAEK
jgi:nitrate reductase cytochrome c-type subunit